MCTITLLNLGIVSKLAESLQEPLHSNAFSWYTVLKLTIMIK